jgi:hypothetical protein
MKKRVVIKSWIPACAGMTNNEKHGCHSREDGILAIKIKWFFIPLDAR